MRVGPPREPAPYPFAELDRRKEEVRSRGVELIDFGMGEPRDPTPEIIRQALVDAIAPTSPYPRAAGLAGLREAISGWVKRRFDAHIDAGHVLPLAGSKEIVHSLPAYLNDDGRDTVVICTPAYPVYERGAAFHGKRVVELVLTADNGFQPQLASVPEEVWERTALLWVNYPHNPTGATVPASFMEEAAALARRKGFVVASDEAYSEIWFDTPPPSFLQLDDLTNVLVVNSLSKRSCMAGYRSGFLTGDPQLMKRITAYRPAVGVTPPEIIQRASIVAWNDEAHVTDLRERFAEKRTLVSGALDQLGLAPTGEASFFLWFAVASGHTSASFAESLLELGIVVTPGNAFGPGGEGYCRMALVPDIDTCHRAMDRLLSANM